MASKDTFTQSIQAGYTFMGEHIQLGAAMLGDEVLKDAVVSIPLKTLNRHGLIAGATGTGKTKTLQVLAENLSLLSVPVLMMDIKGDLSGLAAAGTANAKISDRHQVIDLPWTAKEYPVELLTISEQDGVRLRATASEFGPVLMSKILELNETQGSVLAMIFKWCDDNCLPLLDLKDLKKVLQYVNNEGKAEIEKEYGLVSTSSTGIILRKIVELEQQGAERFFGEKSFEVEDLTRISDDGYGMINILRLNDLQDRPKMFSTFMLCLLAEIYSTFPEEGDLDAPKLVIFIDEAHLIFAEASGALLDQIETMVKLIRSKGVGLLFCTQNPDDVPQAVLSQLGLKVQHALRAFTAKDRKGIKLAAENFPETPYYQVDELLTQLGIGEALVTALDEKGIPTPLVRTLLRAPQSRMDVLSGAEISAILGSSKMVVKYNKDIDRESAYELLNQKLVEAEEAAIEAEKQQQQAEQEAKAEAQRQKEEERRRKEEERAARRPAGKSTFERVATSSVANTVVREVTRGILGVLGLGGRSRSSSSRKRSKPSWW
jgi:DNA helicase HerA-like ATPase